MTWSQWIDWNGYFPAKWLKEKRWWSHSMQCIDGVHVCCLGSPTDSITGRNYDRAFLQPWQTVRERSYDLLFEKGISAPKTKSQGSFPPSSPLHVHSTAMYIRLENKSSDGFFHQCFCEWKNLYSWCQEMIYANWNLGRR